MNTLVVGIGSPHGDDQAGWRVADRVTALQTAFAVRRAQTPADLLDWLDGVERLILCDACAPAQEPGSVRHWIWPADFTDLRSLSSHGLGLASVLSLAEILGKLPREVHLWGIEAVRCEPGDELSVPVLSAIDRVAIAICDQTESKTQRGR